MIDLTLGLSDVGTDNGPTAGYFPGCAVVPANGSALRNFNAWRGRCVYLAGFDPLTRSLTGQMQDRTEEVGFALISRREIVRSNRSLSVLQSST